LRILESSAAKGLLLRTGFIAEGAGQQAGNGVDDDHGREAAVGKDVIPDRQFVMGQGLPHAIVDALIAAADDQQVRECGQLAGHGLVKDTAGWGHEHNSSVGVGEGRSCFEDGLGFEKHSRSAAEWAVIHRVMSVASIRPQVMNLKTESTGFAGSPDDAIIQRAGEDGGEKG